MLLWDMVLFFCSSPTPLGHVCLSLGLKTGGKRKQAHSNTKTPLATAGRHLAGVGRGAAGASSREWLCQERAPHVVRGAGWKPQKKYEHKTGRAGRAGGPRHPLLSTGSPRGPTCGFSPVRRNTEGGCLLVCLGSRITPSALPSTGTPRVPQPAGGRGCGSSSSDKTYFYSEGYFCSLSCWINAHSGGCCRVLGAVPVARAVVAPACSRDGSGDPDGASLLQASPPGPRRQQVGMSFRKAESPAQDLALLLPSPPCLCSPRCCRCCAGRCARQLPSPPCPGVPVTPLPLGTATVPLPLPSSSRSPWTLRGQSQQKFGVPIQTSALSSQGPLVPKGTDSALPAQRRGRTQGICTASSGCSAPSWACGGVPLTPGSGSRLAGTHKGVPARTHGCQRVHSPVPSPARRSLRWSMRSRLSSRLSTCALIWLSSPLMECSSSARTVGRGGVRIPPCPPACWGNPQSWAAASAAASPPGILRDRGRVQRTATSSGCICWSQGLVATRSAPSGTLERWHCAETRGLSLLFLPLHLRFVRPAVELVLLLAPGWGLRLLLLPAPT